MECLASHAKSTHVKAPTKITTKPLTYDQSPAFQVHSLQIILLGPFTYEPNVILGSLNNRVPTTTYFENLTVRLHIIYYMTYKVIFMRYFRL